MMIGYHNFINKAAPSLEALCTCLNQRDGWSLMWGDTGGLDSQSVGTRRERADWFAGQAFSILVTLIIGPFLGT